MRVRLWLVVVFLVSRHLGVAAAEGEPRDSIAGEGVTGNAAVADTPLTRDAAKARVTVRVYSSTRIAAGAQRAALDVAQATFAAAWVQIVWKICTKVACDAPLSATEVALRMVQLPEGDGDRHLGNALIDPQNRTGVLATVYVNRTLRLARELEIDHHKLLGRTVAHEIGHLLLATNTHAASGLMREIWSRGELLQTRREDWILHPLDVLAILRRLEPEGHEFGSHDVDRDREDLSRTTEPTVGEGGSFDPPSGL